MERGRIWGLKEWVSSTPNRNLSTILPNPCFFPPKFDSLRSTSCFLLSTRPNTGNVNQQKAALDLQGGIWILSSLWNILQSLCIKPARLWEPWWGRTRLFLSDCAWKTQHGTVEVHLLLSLLICKCSFECRRWKKIRLSVMSHNMHFCRCCSCRFRW